MNEPKYYDHEPAYQAIRATGGSGWDDRLGAQPEPGSYRSLREFLASAHCPPAGRALEVGCGGGQASLLLARAGFDVCAVDFAPTAIELANANAKAADLAIQFSVGDVTSLPEFADESFDLVVDNHLLHCLVLDTDRRAALAEWRRVLKPGGLVFTESMTSDGDFDAARVGADAEGRTARRIWTSRSTLNAELEAAGLHVVRQTARAESPGFGDLLFTLARR